MSRSPSTDMILPMDDSPESSVDMTTTTVSSRPSQPHFLWEGGKNRPATKMKPELGRPMPVMESIPDNSNSKQFTHRQRAEIQLDAILNEPEGLLAAANHGSAKASNNTISIADASKQLNTQPFIVDRLMKALFKLEKKELNNGEVEKIARVLTGTTDVRALLFFLILDESTDQYVTRGGLTDFYEQYLKDMKAFDKDQVGKLIPAVLQKFHLDEKARIDFEEFYSIIRNDSSILEAVSQFTIDPKSLVKSKAPQQSKYKRFLPKFLREKKRPEKRKKKLSLDDIKDNLPRIIIVLLYILANLGLALYVIIYRAAVVKNHVLVVFARIGGMLLNFNSSFIIILMLKRTILLIRTNQFLRKIIPVDDHIDFHRIVGRVIAGLAIMHTIAHIANFARLNDYSWGVYMFTRRPDIGWLHGFAPLSGVILSIILAIMVIFSMEWIRRGGHFQIFYWTHLLYVPYFAFLIVHSRYFWEWVIGPLSLLLLEKIYSILSRFSSRRGRTYLHAATIEQSNVVSLSIHRPRNFTFKPGDYITINIPHVALYEFHPFTLSSAPEDTKHLTIHMQAVGNWTKRVYKRFNDMAPAVAEGKHIKIYRGDRHPAEAAAELQETIERQNSRDSESELESDDDGHTGRMSRLKKKSKKREVVFINGPYSSCARYVFDCKHVVLVGGGIGVTPYASILSSLMAQFRASRVVCTNCDHVNYHKKGIAETHRLMKVDFIWVNRDQKSFEWFLNLLRQFEQEQEDYMKASPNEKRFLDIHLYFTEIKNEANIGHVPLALVSRVWEEVAGKDIFTSLKSKTYVGRPKWEEIFDRFITGENASTADDVNVFFCGPSTMGNTIRDQCAKYKFRYYEEKF